MLLGVSAWDMGNDSDNLTRNSSLPAQQKPTISKPTVTRLTSFIDSPTLHPLDVAANDLLPLFRDDVKKITFLCIRGGEQHAVEDVTDGAIERVSDAVEALCIALGPGVVRETLPTNIL